MQVKLENPYPSFKAEAEYRCPKIGEWIVDHEGPITATVWYTSSPWLVLTPYSVPAGYEIVDYRRPEFGEYFLGFGTACTCDRLMVLDTSVTPNRLILKKIEPQYREPDHRDIGKEVEVWDHDFNSRLPREYAGQGGSGTFWAYNPTHPGTIVPWQNARVLVEPTT